MVEFTFAFLAVCLPGWLVATRLFPQQPLSAALLYLCLVLGQITVIELVLGVINLLTKPGLVIGALLIGAILFWLGTQLPVQFAASYHLPVESHSWGSDKTTVPLQLGHLNRRGAIGLLLIALIPILLFKEALIGLGTQIAHVHPLSWDVVSYHLPNVLSYLQTGSLWTIEGTYNYYPGGNELLQIWSFLPLKSDVFLGINTAVLGLGVFLVSALILQTVLTPRSAFEAGFWTILLWVYCFAIFPFQLMLFDFGRNDLAVMFWVLVALWTLQRSTEELQQRPFWLLSTGLSLGMAVGTKPTGLVYLAGFVILICMDWFPSAQPSRRLKAWDAFRCLMLPAILLSGFWYGRNLLQFGSVTPGNLMVKAAELSIINNLFNPQLYQPKFSLFFFGLTVILILLSIGVWMVGLMRNHLPFKLVTAFTIVAFFALILTPSGAGYWAGNTAVFDIQIRYGAALVPATGILILFFIRQVLLTIKQNRSDWQVSLERTIASLHQPSPPISSRQFLAILNGIGAMVLIVQLLIYQAPVGLPGFDQVLFVGNNPPSQIYAWVQKHLKDTVIYSVGLRPYGLYGFPFNNQVVYDLGSSDWTYKHGREVLQSYQPKFIAISRDPFNGKFPDEISSLIRQPQSFPVVYADPLAIVFQVKNNGQ